MALPRVFVDGQEGTTGLRIQEYLAPRADLELLTIAPERRKDPQERARLLNQADVAFLCLPDEAAREAVGLVTSPTTRIIDASTAHRIDPAWVYGLPELDPGQRQRLREARRIANPGCHATAFLLLVRPLVEAGLVPPTMPLSATSLTGHSGGGKKMIEQYRQGGDPELEAPRPYALSLAHKHLPEMKAHARLASPPLFVPVVGAFFQGLAVTIPLHLELLPPGVTAARIHEALAGRYADEPFVRVQPLSDPAVLARGFFDVQGSNGSNRADLFVFAGQGQVLLVGRIDNLGKGASGAAVQCMNLCLGLDEATGLACPTSSTS
ncbi:MAG: N-acetyl-gamma-glutamyl-phosphate reductase [Polyangiaceae bacterium]|jgi:N-acetyl-gamma-glutamyl-phosphate reductase|nr:N-acetyl-gamma-glutamyl-phosphate reductase [Polyangiaceae bacterium]